jgi:hypothetical protein
MTQAEQDLPDYIQAGQFSNVIVKLNGKQVYLCEEANRKEGWVKVLVTESAEVDNFHPEATPIRPVVDDELHGTVTFHIQ